MMHSNDGEELQTISSTISIKMESSTIAVQTALTCLLAQGSKWWRLHKKKREGIRYNGLMKKKVKLVKEGLMMFIATLD
ncbi:hypothetical protein JHK87_048910 [Glycine soja]|nr:hypothetical protein JHK87_048910 [Glycine soja]